MLKKIVLISLVFLPNVLKIIILNRFFNAQIDKSAKIGLSYIHCNRIIMGKNTRIGHFNVIKNINLLQLDDDAGFGNLNKITAIPIASKKHFTQDLTRSPHFIMHQHSSMTGHHYIDCCGGVTIGKFSIIAGMRTSIFTHGINIQTNTQEAFGVVIGKYCMIGTQSIILKGANLPDYSVLGAGSVLQKAYQTPYTLYSGVPAQAIKTFDTEAKFFMRDTGFVT
jgi:acetyltransferase-like isoleucine patch superfamily enzyme